MEVIKGFDLKKYKPKVVVIEYLDLSVKKLEIKIRYKKLFKLRNLPVYDKGKL